MTKHQPKKKSFKERFDPSHVFDIGKGLSRIPGFAYRQREGEDFPASFESTRIGLCLDKKYLSILITLIILTAVILAGRVFYLQVLRGEHYKALAEGNRTKIERTVAPRGLIYDSSLTPLVKNEPIFSLKIIPANLPRLASKKNELLVKVAALIKSDSYFKDQPNIHQYLVDLVNQVALPTVLVVAPVIDFETALAIKLESDLPGIWLEQGIKRQYLEGDILGHILGYLGEINPAEVTDLKDQGYYFGDSIGRAGLEAEYEDILKGQDELVSIEVNIKGEEQKVVSKETVKPGANLVLALNLELQKRLTQSLARHANAASGKGAAVALNPQTGEILALVSLPAYDSNIFVNRDNEAISQVLQDLDQPLFNRAITGTYPPGSTFKPVVAAAALAEGIITPQTSFMSTGGLELGPWFFPDWQAGGHGRTNLYKAIAESINTYFYYIGGGFEDFTGLGVDRINIYARRFGLSSPLGVDLPGESAGFLPTRLWKEKNKQEPWYVGDTYHLSIGQGDLLVTPLQLASMTSVFANGGRLYQPHLVKLITDESNEIIRVVEPVLLDEQVLEPEHIEAVRKAYQEAVFSGSAVSLQALPVTAAGKTGTAQVGGDQQPHGWFTGWAPYDQPEIVLTVLVENGVGGNTSALPVFSEVLQWYFSR